MISERHGGAIHIWAPAKVNLFLEVLKQRADGYHEIATLMAAVTLWDTLTFEEETGGTVTLVCDHPELSAGPENLVSRAAELLRRRTGCESGARIQLRKRIPMAAGLAGGSTNAAATLHGLSTLWRLGKSTKELADLGAELGSDVPFFFGAPAAWCTGRGEIVQPVPIGKAMWFVLVCPAAGLSTADVYRNVVLPEKARPGDDIRKAVQTGEVEEIAAGLHNRLEEPARRLCPAIAQVKAGLESLGPAGVLMSGSGTSVFALCRNRDQALSIARDIRHSTEKAVRPTVHLVRSTF